MARPHERTLIGKLTAAMIRPTDGFVLARRLPLRVCGVALLAFAFVSIQMLRADAQSSDEGDPVDCPEGQGFVMPPEFQSSNGILRGTIKLVDEFRRLPDVRKDKKCRAARVRVFKGEGLPDVPSAGNSIPGLPDAIPGPTLRASVGDLVQLTFVNEVNPNRFDLDIDACTKVAGGVYPAGGVAGKPFFRDQMPNCLHASSTANIHFHGTHTNPNSTGDNVYLQIRGLPRDDEGKLTMDAGEAIVGFREFFSKCAENLQNPLNQWPATWADVPKAWIDKQAELLVAYQQKNKSLPAQQFWDENQKIVHESWPIHYIGAFPYCFALPAYTASNDEKGEQVWPPKAEDRSPIMGQAPGTHWYHAHKHGSTAINVSNGMTGAFIIEGQYDKDLDKAYEDYFLEGGNAWKARFAKVLVLNQLTAGNPNMMTTKVDNRQNRGGEFSVNGRLRPRIKMQPGEVQLWRIVNTSGRTAAYFMAPKADGLEWRQIAQDGVQFADAPYQKSHNKPFYMAPANRVDLLVRAPMKLEGQKFEVLIQNVMGRSMVRPNPDQPNLDPDTVSELLTVEVAGPRVKQNNQDADMPFLPTMFKRPKFLTDITDDELRESNYVSRTLVFDSKQQVEDPPEDPDDKNPPSMKRQHRINDIQFGEPHAHLNILLGATEEWTVMNRTTKKYGPNKAPIDHPLHIHINPFQVTEIFDPNEVIMVDNKPVWRYRLTGEEVVDKSQCELDPHDKSTWREGGKEAVQKDHACAKKKESGLVWWDVFAIPAGRAPKDKNDNPIMDSENKPVVIPGYYKMRSRFVDYPGLYVMHCHILIHEDRGMMFSVEVLKGKAAPAPVRHH